MGDPDSRAHVAKRPGRRRIMNTRHIIITAAAGTSLLFLAACSASTQSTPATEQPSASQSDRSCQVATIDGQTSNTEMQALATEVFDSLQCGASESLPDQLKAAAADPAVKTKAKDAGATLSVDSAAGGTVLRLVAGSSGCTVTVLDSMDAKTATCLDL
jgi:hypothetical protein